MTFENTQQLLADLTKHSKENGLDLETAIDMLKLSFEGEVMLLQRIVALENENAELRKLL